MPTNQFTTTQTDLDISPANIHHAIDDIGILVGLDRLPEEEAATFRDRVMDVFVNKANASYPGLLNGINRQLGFIPERTLEIGLRSSVDMDSGPRIEFNSTNITIYSSWGINKDTTVEMTIDTFNDFISPRHTYGARYISDVVEYINAYSSIFEATLSDSSKIYSLASNLVPKSSVKLSTPELLKAQHHKLRHEYIVPGSIVFNDSRPKTELSFRGLDFDTDEEFSPPTDEEIYWIDYDQGYVSIGIKDPRGISVSYLYHDFPLVVYTMPVELYAFTDRHFQEMLYEAVLDTVSTYERGLITSLGAQWVNNILLEGKSFWGVDVIRNTPIAANDRKTDIIDDLNLSNVENVVFESSVSKGYNYTRKRGLI